MVKRFIAPIMATVFLAGILGALTGCNTMEGAGKDIEQGGRVLKDEARQQRQ